MTATVPIPPSANRLWRVVRRYRTGKPSLTKSPKYAAWLPAAVLALRMGLPKPPLPCRVLVVVRGGRGWERGRDLDNCQKAVLDALRHAERIPDDSWECVAEVRVRYEPGDGGDARCEVCFFAAD